MIPAQRGNTVCEREAIMLDLKSRCECTEATRVSLQASTTPDAFQVEAERLQELMQDKGELLLRVQTLRKASISTSVWYLFCSA